MRREKRRDESAIREPYSILFWNRVRGFGPTLPIGETVTMGVGGVSVEGTVHNAESAEQRGINLCPGLDGKEA